MTYRAGLGLGFGVDAREPMVTCDEPGCVAKFTAREGRGGGPPKWLRNGTAPPGWKLVREGDKRRDFCPLHDGRPRSDFTLIDDPAFRTHAARNAFKAAMRNRAYGREAINDAWAWFRVGWDDGWNAYDSAVIATGGRSVGRAIR